MVTELVIYVFGVFIAIIGGTPDKRIPEGLFLTFFDKVRVLIFAHQNRFYFHPSKQSSFYIFGVFVDSRGGIP